MIPCIRTAGRFKRMTDINKYFYYSVLFLSGLTFSSSSNADKAENQIGVGLMYFDYAEYRDNNEFLDGETGFIPGLILKRKQYNQNIYTEFVGQLYGNIIEYDGETQISGIPLKTDSVAIIADTHFKIGMIVEEKHKPYFGLGYRYWYRHILSSKLPSGQSVNPLLEEYNWFYFLVGIEADIFEKNGDKVGFDLRLTKMFNSHMKINYLGYGFFDNTQVNLGDELGARLALPIQIKSKNSLLFITPYYEMINIGKSNVVRATSGGLPTIYVTWEPRSETRNIGIEITWLW